MGNSLRCCLACVSPCGTLDLIRIVHLNGHVDEITHSITASEVLKANPNRVLSKPSSQVVVRQILFLSNKMSFLIKRGIVYFLIPFSSVPEKKRGGKNDNVNLKMSLKKISKKSNRSTIDYDHHRIVSSDCNRYLSDFISEKKASHCRDYRKSSLVGVWRPHLQNISED